MRFAQRLLIDAEGVRRSTVACVERADMRSCDRSVFHWDRCLCFMGCARRPHHRLRCDARYCHRHRDVWDARNERLRGCNLRGDLVRRRRDGGNFVRRWQLRTARPLWVGPSIVHAVDGNRKLRFRPLPRIGGPGVAVPQCRQIECAARCRKSREAAPERIQPGHATPVQRDGKMRPPGKTGGRQSAKDRARTNFDKVTCAGCIHRFDG